MALKDIVGPSKAGRKVFDIKAIKGMHARNKGIMSAQITKLSAELAGLEGQLASLLNSPREDLNWGAIAAVKAQIEKVKAEIAKLQATIIETDGIVNRVSRTIPAIDKKYAAQIRKNTQRMQNLFANWRATKPSININYNMKLSAALGVKAKNTHLGKYVEKSMKQSKMTLSGVLGAVSAGLKGTLKIAPKGKYSNPKFKDLATLMAVAAIGGLSGKKDTIPSTTLEAWMKAEINAQTKLGEVTLTDKDLAKVREIQGMLGRGEITRVEASRLIDEYVMGEIQSVNGVDENSNNRQAAEYFKNYELSEDYVTFVKDYEGYHLSVYDDGKGNLTVGYGHVITGNENPPINAIEGTIITEEQARQLLESDFQSHKRNVTKVMGELDIELTESQFEGVVDFSFNAGPNAKTTPEDGSSRENYRIRQILIFIDNNDREGLESFIMQYGTNDSATGKGVTKRRNDELDIIFNGEYDRDEE